MPKITVEVSEETHLLLQARALHHGAKISEILAGFAADLAGSAQSNGSDERNLADDWIRRGPLGRPAKLTEKQEDRMEILVARAREARRKHNLERGLHPEA